MQRQDEIVLSMAKAESNTLTLRKEEIDAQVVIDSILLPFDGQVKLQFDAVTPNVHADPFHFRNMISNLIDNALKYSPGEPDVWVKTVNKKHYLVISIEDKGLGIAPEFQKKIFNKFFRVPYGDVHNVKGSGIGLSYVKQIVRSHHWHLESESKLAQGSVFRIFVPQR